MRSSSTTFTCDRCGTSKTYDHASQRGKWKHDWTVLWPEIALHEDIFSLHRDEVWVPGHVCRGCLTERERELFAAACELYAEADFPF